MSMNMINNRGGALVVLLAIVWLIVFFVGMFAFFAYKANYLRVEFGPEEIKEEIIYDKNTIAHLERREKELQEKSKAIVEQQIMIDRIHKQIQLEKQSVVNNQEKINKDLTNITGLFEKYSAEEEADIKRLARMYESMKPKKVATIFNELETEKVADLLKRIKSRQSAKILAEIGQENAHRAAEISDLIQGQNKTDAFG